MSQCAVQQRPRSAAEASPCATGVRSIREEAAALRAAQAAGTQSPSFCTKAQLDDFFARRRVRPRAPPRPGRSSDALARRGSRRCADPGVEAGGRALGAHFHKGRAGAGAGARCSRSTSNTRRRDYAAARSAATGAQRGGDESKCGWRAKHTRRSGGAAGCAGRRHPKSVLWHHRTVGRLLRPSSGAPARAAARWPLF